jgi:hypothetical protein
MKTNKKKLLCVGAGYSARVIACELLSNNKHNKWSVYGSYRKQKQAEVLSKLGIIPIKFNNLADNLLSVDAILSSIPPDKEGDPVLNQYGAILSKLNKKPWIGYFSTTGVYGDTKGSLVDETAPLNPTTERGKRRVAAENIWLKHNAHIFRLPGIYGHGRSSLDRVRDGLTRRVHRPNHLFSRIHVDDISQCVIASMNKPNPGTVYNVCDDEAAEQQLVDAYASKLLGKKPPPLVRFKDAAKEMTPMALSFWQDNRRVNNTKIKSELGVKLFYPTFREGLKSLHENVEGINKTL